MATNKRTTPRADAEPPAPPPRRWGRAILWLGLIAVLVGVAVAVSFVGHDKSDDELNTEPLASEQFCTEAASFRSFDHLDLESDGADQLRDLSLSARRLASLSPPGISQDFDDVAQALELVAQSVDQVPADDPDRLGIVTQHLDDELAGVQEQADRAGAYVDKWCGPIPTTEVTASDTTAG